MKSKERELLEAAQFAVDTSQRLMDEMKVYPGQQWGPAFNRLRRAALAFEATVLQQVRRVTCAACDTRALIKGTHPFTLKYFHCPCGHTTEFKTEPASTPATAEPSIEQFEEKMKAARKSFGMAYLKDLFSRL